MATQRYYLSRDPTKPSPPLGELRSIEAETPAAAITKLTSSDELPRDWLTIWVHILVWTSRDGRHHGFESTRVRG